MSKVKISSMYNKLFYIFLGKKIPPKNTSYDRRGRGLVL